MAENRLEVSLAVDDAETGLRKLRATKQEMRELGESADKAERKVDELGDEFSQTGRKADQYGRSVGRSSRQTDALSRAAAAGVSRLVAVGSAAAAAGASLAAIGTIRVGAGFEQQMSAVLAITQATDSEFKALGQTARELGAATVFSAREAAQGMESLARAGFDANEIIDALPGTLDLAAAGGLEFARASEIAASSVKQFALETREIGRVADVLAKAAASANVTVEGLGEALKFAGPTAQAFGISLEETVAAISALGDVGLQGGLAGRGFGAVVTQLENNRAAIVEIIGEYDLAADGLESVFRRLGEAGITNQQAIDIFRAENIDIISALKNAALDAAGGLGAFRDALKDVDGFAREVAETRMANLLGSFEEFSGALEELFITAASDGGALESLKDALDGLTEALRSDAAKEFAENFGGAIRDTTDAAIGLLAVMRDIAEFTEFAGREGTPIAAGLGALQFLEQATPIGSVNKGAGDILEALARRGREEAALRETTPVSIKVPTDISGVIAEIGRAEDVATEFEKRLSAIGEDNIIGGALRAFDTLNKSLVAANDNAKQTAESIADIKPPEVGPLQQSLLDQLAIAERIAQAAGEGGETAVEFIRHEVELQAAVDDLFKRAKEAGEDLSRAQIEGLVSQIDRFDQSTQKLLEAEQRLLDRIQDTREDIADGLDKSIQDFIGDVREVDFGSRPALRDNALGQFEERLRRLIEDFEIESIGLDPDDVENLEQRLKDAAIFFGKTAAEDIEDAARRGALGLGAAISQAIEDGASRLEATAEGVRQISEVGRDIIGSISRSLDIIRDPDAALSDKILGSIENIGSEVADAVRLIPGGEKVAAVIETVAGVAGFVKDAINLFKELFGKRSNFTAQGVFDPSTGFIAGVAQDAGANANARARDALIDSITEAGRQLVSLLGGATTGGLPGPGNERFLNVAVRSDRKTGEPFIDVGFQGPGGEPIGGGRFTDVQQAFEAALQLTIQSLRGGESALLDYAKAASQSGQSFEDIVKVLGVLDQALDTGQESLAKYALAAARGGLSADEIVDGLNKIDAALKLAAPELSNVEKELKNIDSAINPAIAALKAAGQAFEDIAEIGREAGRAVAVNFLEGVQEDIERLQSEALADFRALLRNQAADLADAQLLLDRGLITGDEFRTVEQRNALQQSAFFENLDQDALNELGDHLGLIRENGGEAAVVLLQFNQELDRTREKLTDGLSAMREEADRFFAAARANFNLSDDIRLRLSSETGSAQLVTFRAELQGLLAQAQGPDRIAAVEAAERAPDVAQQFIQLAEQRLGASGGLAGARDFVTDILDQIGTAAQGFGNETLDAIGLAEQQVGLLDQIKGVLESPDPALGVLENILANGEIQNATLRDLLDQYIQLAYAGPAQSFTPGQVQQAATQIVLPSELRISNTVTTDAPSTTLAITTAASQAKQDAEDQRELLESIEKRLGDQDEAIRKLDATLRAA